MEKALAAKDAEVAQARNSYEAAAAKLQERRTALAECEQGIAALQAERAQLSKALSASGVERKKLENRCVLWLGTQSSSGCIVVSWQGYEHLPHWGSHLLRFSQAVGVSAGWSTLRGTAKSEQCAARSSRRSFLANSETRSPP